MVSGQSGAHPHPCALPTAGSSPSAAPHAEVVGAQDADGKAGISVPNQARLEKDSEPQSVSRPPNDPQTGSSLGTSVALFRLLLTLLGACLYTAGWAYAYHYFGRFRVGLLALDIPYEYYFVIVSGSFDPRPCGVPSSWQVRS